MTGRSFILILLPWYNQITILKTHHHLCASAVKILGAFDDFTPQISAANIRDYGRAVGNTKKQLPIWDDF